MNIVPFRLALAGARGPGVIAHPQAYESRGVSSRIRLTPTAEQHPLQRVDRPFPRPDDKASSTSSAMVAVPALHLEQRHVPMKRIRDRRRRLVRAANEQPRRPGEAMEAVRIRKLPIGRTWAGR